MGSKKRASCSICLYDYAFSKDPVVATACGHVFHSQCINTWLKKDDECPLCRETVGSTMARVYLSFAEEENSNENNFDVKSTATENTPFNNARISSSTLRLESLISQEIQKTNKRQTELIMSKVKQLIDPLVNEVAKLSGTTSKEFPASNPSTHQPRVDDQASHIGFNNEVHFTPLIKV